jgi:alpha-tubulin suppressor-like RCC1 family protein
VGQVSAGLGGCAVTVSGAPSCWGGNFDGQIGNGTTTDESTPVPVSGLPDVEEITTGGTHSCALVHNGGAWCWGDNVNGDVGDGSTTQRDAPVAVKNLPTALAQISAGGGQTCALLEDQTVKCWGTGSSGELGNGSTSNKSTPVAVKGLSGVVQTALGDDFSCALTGGGGVSCWGYNGDGELGNGTTSNSDVPVGVSGLSAGATAIAAGSDFACAVLQSGGVDCWGDNSGGQLGDGTFTSSTVPVSVPGYTSDGASIGIGGSAFTACSLNSAEVAECWGGNFDGQVGDGTMTNAPSPTMVIGL